MKEVEGRIKQVIIKYGEWFALRKKQRLQRKRLRSQYKGINSDSKEVENPRCYERWSE